VSTIESLKKGIEQVTGLWRPRAPDLRALVIPRNPRTYRFASDGKTPNNHLPLVIFKHAVLFRDFDPASVFEKLFATNGWEDAWRDGMYPYEHFHSETHEVLGIARGMVRARFGGRRRGLASGHRPQAHARQPRPAGGRRLSGQRRRLR
jgi:hypothetical protein